MVSYSVSDQVILVSGGSQGLGESFAKEFTKYDNNTVIIVSRSKEKLIAACQRIKREPVALKDYETYKASKESKEGGTLLYHPTDVSNYDSLIDMFELLIKFSLIPTQVFMCAGGSVPKLFTDLTPEELNAGVLTNYLTSANLAHISLKHDVAHLLFFSSEVAFFPFIGYSQYAPLKQSIKSLVAILRQEHRGKRISCVYPGNFQSEGYDLENLTKPSITREIEGPSHPISAADCRDKIIASLKSGYDDITTDSIGWILMACDQGFNKHGTGQFLFPIAWLLGCILNLFIVPIYMKICDYQIKKWKNSFNTAKSSDKKS